jgi:HTH-type transcriptional regulator / antitoxin HigA
MATTVNPLYNEADYEAALREVETLMDAAPGTPEFDRLHVLSILVEAYEAVHHPVAAPDPVSALRHYVDAHGITYRQLEEVLNCGSGRVSEILNRKRSLTLGMIRELHERFGISPEILVREYALDADDEARPEGNPARVPATA